MTAKNYSKIGEEEVSERLAGIGLSCGTVCEGKGFEVPDGCLLNIKGYVSASRRLAEKFTFGAVDPSDWSLTVFHAISPREKGNVARLLYARKDLWQFAAEGDRVVIDLRKCGRTEFELSKRMSLEEFNQLLGFKGMYARRYAGEDSDYVAVYESRNTTKRSVPVGMLNLCYPQEIFDTVLDSIFRRHDCHDLRFTAVANWKKGCLKLRTSGDVDHEMLMQGTTHMFEVRNPVGVCDVFKGRIVNERESLCIHLCSGYSVPSVKAFEEVEVKVWDAE